MTERLPSPSTTSQSASRKSQSPVRKSRSPRKSQIEIPERTSSKRALEVQRDELKLEAKRMRKELKPQGSFNSAYWLQNAAIVRKMKSAVELHEEILEQTHKEEGHEVEFSQTLVADKLHTQLRALEADERLFKLQAQNLNTGPPRKSFRRAFMELFTTSTLGLGISKTGRGRRGTSDQSNFRRACIEKYNSRDSTPQKGNFLWCPILRLWCNEEFTNAAHLFPYMHGQDMMDTIFGSMEPSELFSPLNGLIISSLIEKRFDNGFMVIVPLVSDNPTPTEVTEWNATDPKEYKIRILNLKAPEVNKFISPYSQDTWKDLDGRKLEFRSSFRPRARYLYFHYCIQILRRAWQLDQQAEKHLQKEFGKGYWGTVGKFLPKAMLQAFIEELGHEYNGLLAGAADDEVVEEQDRYILLGAGSAQVKASARLPGLVEESTDDEDESEGEDES